MKREEIIEVLEHPEDYLSIAYEHARAYPAASSRLIESIRCALDVVKKESDSCGCEFCRKFNFSHSKAGVDKYGAYIKLAGGAHHYPENERFSYCPICGRKLLHNSEDIE